MCETLECFLKGSDLILTRFQPGDLVSLMTFEPFQRFLIGGAEGKPLKRFGNSDRRYHPVETG